MPSYPLEKFWPRDLLADDLANWKTDPKFSRGCRIVHEPPDGFVLVSDEEPAERIKIPSRYKNGVRLLNAKISCFQGFATVMSEPAPPETTKRALRNLKIALTCGLQILAFNQTVRESFLSGVRRVRGRNAEKFRCPHMDAWMFCEFHYGTHDPALVQERIIGECQWKLADNGE